jgi:multidrug transporter EmrE-like cation transporter
MSFFAGRLIPFVAAVALQLITVALLPRTKGFTAPLQTLECLGAFSLSLWMIARIAYNGASLGILIPLLNALVPMGAIAIGVFLYGEAASVQKMAMLFFACTLIGVASRIH